MQTVPHRDSAHRSLLHLRYFQPDHYSSPIFNTYIPGWDNFDYNSAWKRFAGAVAASVPINFEGGPRFQFGSAAQIQQGYIWTPSGLLGTDLLDSPEAKLIGTYSEHSYQVRSHGQWHRVRRAPKALTISILRVLIQVTLPPIRKPAHSWTK